MSLPTLYTEITRIQQAKADLKSSLENKGISVASNAKIDSFATYVEDLEDTGLDYVQRDKQEMTISDRATTIAPYAFYGNTTVTDIQVDGLGNADELSLMAIGDHAFDGCSSLVYFGVPEPCLIKTIGTSVFYNCYNMTEIMLPYSLGNIVQVPDGGSLQCISIQGAAQFNWAYNLGSNVEIINGTFATVVPNITSQIAGQLTNENLIIYVPTIL